MRWATAFLDAAAGDGAATAEFWCAVTGSSSSVRRGVRGEFVTLVPPDGDPYLRVQELTTGPGRVHLDLHVDDVAVTTQRATALGAQMGADRSDGVAGLVSPGGFAFCLVRHQGESTRPVPTRWADGQRSLVDQLSLDLPPSAWEPEQLFWAALTGWTHFGGSQPAYSILWRPDGQPVRLLFQRLDAADPGQPVAGHLDMSCDDVEAEVARHLVLGARVVRRMTFWVTLEDPTGRHYCVTRRNPDTGTLTH